MGIRKLCRLHDRAIFQLYSFDGLITADTDAGHGRLFLLLTGGFRLRLLLGFCIWLLCSIFRQILPGIDIQAKAKHRQIFYQTAHDGLVYIKHGSGFYGAFFHADFLTAARLLVIFPFRGGVGVRHSFHGFICTILETVCSKRKTIRIAGDDYPAELVKAKFMKLNSSHIEFVFDCMKENTTKIRNIKQYLKAVLFNAPNTIDSYYTALVAHDMATGKI